MKFLSRFLTSREVSLNTEFARRRLSRSMPGETAAMNSARLGGMTL